MQSTTTVGKALGSCSDAIAERLLRRTTETATGCLEFPALNERGYAIATINGKTTRVAKWMLQRKLGRQLLPGMQTRHTCDNRACINDVHLVEGTAKDNAQDRAERGRYRNGNTSKTHCKRGHEFTPENTYKSANGRGCDACRIEYRKTHP